MNEREMRLDEKERERYIAGLKHWQEQGVRVLIDGKDARGGAWNKLFEIRRDGGFYMGDYIFEDVSDMLDEEEQTAVVRETVPYGCGKRLVEIRFDKVYNR